jgi:hypothetical protein
MRAGLEAVAAAIWVAADDVDATVAHQPRHIARAGTDIDHMLRLRHLVHV